jgi:hypothetical protein
MCIVSYIGDYGRRDLWPQLPVQPIPDYILQQIGPDPKDAEITRLKQELEKYKKFNALMEAAKQMDTAAGTPDCESPEKTAWIKDLDERMKKIEEALADHKLL